MELNSFGELVDMNLYPNDERMLKILLSYWGDMLKTAFKIQVNGDRLPEQVQEDLEKLITIRA